MAEANRRPVCAVIGVGPGLGAALARRFAAEYVVALIARGEDKLNSLAKEIETAGGNRADGKTIGLRESLLGSVIFRCRHVDAAELCGATWLRILT